MANKGRTVHIRNVDPQDVESVQTGQTISVTGEIMEALDTDPADPVELVVKTSGKSARVKAMKSAKIVKLEDKRVPPGERVTGERGWRCCKGRRDAGGGPGKPWQWEHWQARGLLGLHVPSLVCAYCVHAMQEGGAELEWQTHRAGWRRPPVPPPH